VCVCRTAHHAELARQQNRFCPAPGVSTLAPTPPCARVRESCRACACMHARMRFPGAQDCRAKYACRKSRLALSLSLARAHTHTTSSRSLHVRSQIYIPSPPHLSASAPASPSLDPLPPQPPPATPHRVPASLVAHHGALPRTAPAQRDSHRAHAFPPATAATRRPRVRSAVVRRLTRPCPPAAAAPAAAQCSSIRRAPAGHRTRKRSEREGQNHRSLPRSHGQDSGPLVVTTAAEKD